MASPVLCFGFVVRNTPRRIDIILLLGLSRFAMGLFLRFAFCFSGASRVLLSVFRGRAYFRRLVGHFCFGTARICADSSYRFLSLCLGLLALTRFRFVFASGSGPLGSDTFPFCFRFGVARICADSSYRFLADRWFALASPTQNFTLQRAKL